MSQGFASPSNFSPGFWREKNFQNGCQFWSRNGRVHSFVRIHLPLVAFAQRGIFRLRSSHYDVNFSASRAIFGCLGWIFEFLSTVVFLVFFKSRQPTMIDAFWSGWSAACSRNCAEKLFVVPSPVPCDVITSAAEMQANMRVCFLFLYAPDLFETFVFMRNLALILF